jgi:CheY-like chemotaxis protein
MARVLFIDDDPFTLETLSRAAAVLGHEAITATTGEEALRLASEQSPDLIFSDLRLPDYEGIDLLQQLKSQENTANIPMYILSASPAVDAVERTHAVGAEAYLNKPIRLQTLMEIIQGHIAS